MKATVNSDVLLKELKKLSPVIKKNMVLPILDSILFKFNKNKLSIMGTDLETTYVSQIDCTCKGVFSFPILYTDILGVCSNATAPVELDVDGLKVSVTCGKSKFNFTASGDATEFPNIPEEDFTIELDVDGDFFFNLSNANDFKSKEFTKVNLNMAAIDISKTKICLVGSDANYLFKKELKNKSKNEVVVMVCDEFIQACSSFQDAKISIGEKFIKAECDNETVISRLSENKFCNYSVIIPTEIIYNATIGKNELKSALRSATITANPISKQCVLNFSDGKIKLVSQDIDYGKESESEIEVTHSVEIDAICVNSGQLSAILNHIETDTIDFAFSDAKKTIYLKPTGDETVLCLLQPLYLNN